MLRRCQRGRRLCGRWRIPVRLRRLVPGAAAGSGPAASSSASRRPVRCDRVGAEAREQARPRTVVSATTWSARRPGRRSARPRTLPGYATGAARGADRATPRCGRGRSDEVATAASRISSSGSVTVGVSCRRRRSGSQSGVPKTRRSPPALTRLARARRHAAPRPPDRRRGLGNATQVERQRLGGCARDAGRQAQRHDSAARCRALAAWRPWVEEAARRSGQPQRETQDGGGLDRP